MLKPQDIVVLLKVHNHGDNDWTYSELSHELKMSSSEVHSALKRADVSGLYNRSSKKIKKAALLEFLNYGLKYVFPAKPGSVCRGIPTAHSAEPLRSLLAIDSSDTYVWPDPHGTTKGQCVEPLYKSVPCAIREDLELYTLLSLIDAVRVGRVREQQIAQEQLETRLMA